MINVKVDSNIEAREDYIKLAIETAKSLVMIGTDVGAATFMCNLYDAVVPKSSNPIMRICNRLGKAALTGVITAVSTKHMMKLLDLNYDDEENEESEEKNEEEEE